MGEMSLVMIRGSHDRPRVIITTIIIIIIVIIRRRVLLCFVLI